MGTTNERFVELEQLLSKLHDGLADAGDIAQIESMLAGDPEACEFYMDYTQMVACIEQEAGIREPVNVGRKTVPLAIAQSTALFFEGQNTKQILSPSWRPLPWFAAAAALVMFAGSLALFFGKKHPLAPSEAMAEEMATHNGVAVLMESVGASFGKGGLLPERSRGVLPLGEVRLESGVAEIEFFSGARVLLEGPAIFELDSQNSGVLHAGRVRAQIPPQARGFTLTTSQLEIVDLGTEFGVSIDEDGHRVEVHCFEGKVEVFEAGHSEDAKSLRKLQAGQALRLQPSGIRKIEADSMAFVSYADMAQTALAEASLRHDAWRDYIEELRADNAIVALFSFDDQGPRERTLVNQALYREQFTHGAIVGCRWTNGRWPSKGSLDFKRPSDRINVQSDTAFNTVTLSAWVRIDALQRRASTLLASSGDEPGAVEWAVNREGKLLFTVRGEDGKRIHRYQSGKVLDQKAIGEWHLITTVYDANGGTLVHYLDGRRVHEQKIPNNAAIPVVIGDAQIGNSGVRAPNGKLPVRHLAGRIDEFSIFARAFEDGELQRMVSIGEEG